MTLAGFMRGGGGSTNMRLSRRHCWLPAESHSRSSSRESSSRLCNLLLLLVDNRGWGGWRVHSGEHHPASLCYLDISPAE